MIWHFIDTFTGFQMFVCGDDADVRQEIGEMSAILVEAIEGWLRAV